MMVTGMHLSGFVSGTLWLVHGDITNPSCIIVPCISLNKCSRNAGSQLCHHNWYCIALRAVVERTPCGGGGADEPPRFLTPLYTSSWSRFPAVALELISRRAKRAGKKSDLGTPFRRQTLIKPVVS